MDDEIRKRLYKAQRNEISEYWTYLWLANRATGAKNRKILESIALDEYQHYEIFKRLTEKEIPPRKMKVFFYKMVSLSLGLSFGLRLMERGEQVTQRVYSELRKQLPEMADILMDEQKHETEVLELIKEERIVYAGSIVLGLNDALVELTGALAGLTFALRDSRVIAMAGFITGVAASMSMAASEYLSASEEEVGEKGRNPKKSALYTGVTYIITVLVLITPYLVFSEPYAALAGMVLLSVLIILAYNFYIATAKGGSMWRRFATMAAISLTIAAVSFLVGIAARELFGVEI